MNSKLYTFKSLFGSNFPEDNPTITLDKIVIPIIQRDYAQGRNTPEVKRIRDRFLNNLYQSLVNGSQLKLDFIYGDISEKGILTPLDGQQRLTTLYLLYWYIAKHEGIQESEYNFLHNFTYETRFSSRDFCNELIEFCPNFKSDKLSTQIFDQHWYAFQWKDDPTIQSMLVMLDTIHSKFCNTSGLWQELYDQEIIGFYFLPLSKMGLTDDLYVKMNSRGKPLTPFEHFKAYFEGKIKDKYPEEAKRISHEFDIEWTDMLFPYRGKNQIIDDEFICYFHFISDIICYQQKIPLAKDEFDATDKIYVDNKENILYLEKAFNCWCGINIDNDVFEKFFYNSKFISGRVKIYSDSLNIFQDCCENYGIITGRNRKFPLTRTLLLYAILVYMWNKSQVSEADFERRIRVVRNLILNSSDEIRDSEMAILLKEVKCIIIDGKIENSQGGFNSSQEIEEIQKIDWCSKNPDLVDNLFQLEDHTLLKGCIAIIGLDHPQNFDKFRNLFDNCTRDAINRAMLTFGDYTQLLSWRWQMGAWRNDSVWETLFHPSKQRLNFENTKDVLNKLLGEMNEFTDEELNKISDDYLNNSQTIKDWKYYLIKYQNMRNGNFGCLYWKNMDKKNKPYELIMMNTQYSMSGRNWNVFLHTLFLMDPYKNVFSLGEYGYQGDILKSNKNEQISVDCLNDRYVVNLSQEQHKDFIIPHDEKGIDTVDRIDYFATVFSSLKDKF